MPSEKPSENVYWDSCLFIDLLQQTPGRFDSCDYMRDRAARGQVVIVTSTLSIVEVNKLPDHNITALPEEQSKKILEFFENAYIHVRPLTRAIAERAHELTRLHGLKPNDAVHVATALFYNVPVLYTFDSRQHRRGGLLRLNLKIGDPPLRIEVPPVPSAGPLFDGIEQEAAGAPPALPPPEQPTQAPPETPLDLPPTDS